MIKLSLITSAYNNRSELERLYNSLQPQSDHVYEWILCDDGSTDDTWEFIKSIAEKSDRIEGVQQTKKGWRYGANLNNGFRKATGDVVFSVNADSYFTPTTLKELVRGFIRGSAGSATRINVDSEGNFVSYDWRIPSGTNEIVRVNDFPEFYSYLTGNGLIIERELFSKYGYFDERFKGYGRDDWEFFLRMGKSGVPLYQYNNVQLIVDVEEPKPDNPVNIELFNQELAKYETTQI